MAEKLTEGVVKALAPPRRGSRLIWDTKITGFALRLHAPTKKHPKGARTFLVSCWRNGRERRYRIGAWPDWSVRAARAEARKLRQRIDRGEDPAGDRRKRREQSRHVADVQRMSSPALQPMVLEDRPWREGNPYEGVKLNPEQGKTRFLSPVEIALFFDPRLRDVWKKLYGQRADGTFLYPASDAWWQRRRLLFPFFPSAADARERQVEAMVQLLDTALVCQMSPGVTTTRREAEQQRDRCLDKAQELKRDALTIVANSSADKWDERYGQLRKVAQIYEDYAHENFALAVRIALERKHDGHARWVGLAIANKFHEVFGQPMYGLTATITSVVLGRTVTLRRVRQWCTPADKARKNSP